MFKRLKEKISEEVRDSPLRLQSSLQTLGQYSPFKDNGNKKTLEPEVTPTKDVSQNLIDLQESSSTFTESSQFSIADDDEGCSSPTSPPCQLSFENVDLSETPTSGSSGKGPSVSSGSQSSFFTVYHPPTSNYDIQSDLESASEVEDSGINLDVLSKEQLYQAFQKAKMRYIRSKTRYADVVKAYREQEKEKEKIRTILTESQDKALRRISELREQSSLEKKAKQHLEESFRVTIEEKDELLRVQKIQIRLLKTGGGTLENLSDDALSKGALEADAAKQDDANCEDNLINSGLPVKDDSYENVIQAKALEENLHAEVDLFGLKDSASDDLKGQYTQKILCLQLLLKNYKSWCMQARDEFLDYQKENQHLYSNLKNELAALNNVHEESLQSLKHEISDLQAQRLALNEDVSKLQQELADSTTKLSNSLTEVENHEKKKIELNGEILTYEQNNKELQTLLKEEKEQNSNILLENSRLHEEILALNSTIVNVERQLETLNCRANELTGDIENYKKEENSYQQKLKEFEMVNISLNEQVTSLQAENKVIIEEVNSLRELNDQNDSNLKYSENEIASLQENIATVNHELKILKEQIVAYENDISCLRNSELEKDNELCILKSSFEIEKSGLCENLQLKTKALDELLDECDKLKQDLLNKDGVIASLSSRLTTTSGLETELNVQQKKFEVNVCHLSEEVDHLKNTVTIANENARLQEVIVTSKLEWEKLESNYSIELQKLRETIKNQEKEELELKQQLTEMNNLLTTERNIVVELQEKEKEITELLSKTNEVHDARLVEVNKNFALELDNLKNNTETLICELNSLREQLQSSKLDYEQNIDRLRKEIGVKEIEVQRLSSVHLELQEHNDSFPQKLLEVQERCEALTNERDILQAKLMEFTHSAEEMEIRLKRQLKNKLVELRNRTNHAFSELRSQLHNMKAGIDIERSEFTDKLESLCADIQRKEESLRQELSKNKELQVSYEETILKLNQTIEKLQEKVKSDSQVMTEERFKINTELNNVKSAHEQCHEDLLKKTESYNEIQKLLENSENIKSDLQNKIVELDTSVRESLKMVENGNAKVMYLENQISNLVHELKQLEELNNSLKQTITENSIKMEKLNKESEDKYETLQTELKSEKECNKERLENQEKCHSDKIGDLVQKFKVKIKAHDAQCSELSVENAGLRNQIARLEEASKLREEHIRLTGKKNIEEICLELDMCQTKLSETESQRDAFLANDKVKGENIRHLEDLIQQLKSENATLTSQHQQELSKLSGEINENHVVIQKLQTLNEELERIKESNLTTESKNRIECEELRATLNDLREQMNELKLMIASKEEEMTELESQIEKNIDWAEENKTLIALVDNLRNQAEIQNQEFRNKFQSMEEEKAAELKLKEQQNREETQIKLNELKKKAESKLSQIKKQMQLETEKVKENLESRLSELQEQYKTVESDRQEKTLKLGELQQIGDEVEYLKCQLQNDRDAHDKEKEYLLLEIEKKNSQIDESLIAAQASHMEMTQKLTSLQAEFDEAKAEWELKVEAYSSLAVGKEESVLSGESIANQEGEEGSQTYQELVSHLKAVQEELVKKEQMFESVVKDKDRLIQEKNDELANSLSKITADEPVELEVLGMKWTSNDDQQVDLSDSEVMQDWNSKQKLLENDFNSVAKIDVIHEERQPQTELALSVAENDILQRQIMSMQLQMEAMKERHKAEVCELRDLMLSAKKYSVPLTRSAQGGYYDDQCNLKSLEIEYLKNILFEYMMGRETLTLAKVIAAVVRFSDEQLNKILEREESRVSGVSGQSKN